MIPKASQRAEGQDLATHLLNAQDNEYLEVADVRGAVARDLHGAFAEWELQASAMTRCQNYLYSLSVNPDPAQGTLTRAQYLDYIDRAEDKLGLSGQPRAVIFHIKNGREHCHVIWSRIDTAQGKAIHQAFDHEKLMMVSRQFARDHGLILPEGMEPGRSGDSRRKASQYEKHQENTTGLTKEERMAHVTAAWRRRDNPQAFVHDLQQLGYVLAAGDKRPYVLVDCYGHMNALPKLIDDRSVRTKDIRAFLEKEFPPESLPTVEEARELVAQHRKALKDFDKAQAKSDRRDALKRVQAERRKGVEKERATMLDRQKDERQDLDLRQTVERRGLKSAYRADAKRIRLERERSKPKGLAAFLGRVTGVRLVINKIHKWQDRKRYEAFLNRKQGLADQHRDQRSELDRGHECQALDMGRRVDALDQIERRELRSLETSELRQRRVRSRAGHEHMPELTLELKPRGRRAVPHKAKNRYTSPLAREFWADQAEAPRRPTRALSLQEEFERAAKGDEGRGGGGEDGNGSQGPKPTDPSDPPRTRRTRKQDKDRDKEQ